MRDRLILLPGWGLGVSPLEPLAAALQGLDEHLQVLSSSRRRFAPCLNALEIAV